MYPSYLALYANGKLNRRIKQVYALLESCCLCPRRCGVNRIEDKKGFCKTGRLARVYSYMPHFGEEPPISGQRGSGAIFFSGCNMICVYCQNYKFSQLGQGRQIEAEELAQFMIDLQNSGCHNINLVTPTHVLPQILEALSLGIPRGLKLPLVYNTSGYELSEIIKLLDGIVDIFLCDMRYAEDKESAKYSKASDYSKYNRAAIKQMHQQVGTAKMDKQGIITRGLIIRHLVLPENISGTKEIMRFIANEVSHQAYISLMSQYVPCNKAEEFPELSRRISEQEYILAQEIMINSGLSNGWLQESKGSAYLAGEDIKPR
jgi:putative pyruvate formate lyase activating enzyme